MTDAAWASAIQQRPVVALAVASEQIGDQAESAASQSRWSRELGLGSSMAFACGERVAGHQRCGGLAGFALEMLRPVSLSRMKHLAL